MPKEAPRSGYSCACCHRALTVDTSIRAGIGPICRARLAAEAEDAIRNSCDGLGCLIHPEHAKTILGRARQWISNMADGAGEPLPDQAEILLLVRRMSKTLDYVPDIPPNLACPMRPNTGRSHRKTPEVVNSGAWAVAAWLCHQVEPWLWVRHRNLLEDVGRMYRHAWNLLEVTGAVHEAPQIQEMENRNRSGTKYRKALYRRMAWHPIGEKT